MYIYVTNPMEWIDGKIGVRVVKCFLQLIFVLFCFTHDYDIYKVSLPFRSSTPYIVPDRHATKRSQNEIWIVVYH